MPLLGLRYKNGQFVVSDYIPPQLHVTGDSPLGELCAGIARRVREKGAYLVEIIRSPAMTTKPAVIEENKRLLAFLTSGLPAFEAVLRTGAAHPVDLYIALCGVAGSLTAVGTQLVPPVFPAYDHAQLRRCFDDVRDYIFRTIDEGVSESFTAIPLTYDSGAFGVNFERDWANRVVIMGVKGQPGMSDKEISDWMKSSLVGSQSRFRLLRERRLLGAERAAIDRYEGLVAVKARVGVAPGLGVEIVAGEGEDEAGEERGLRGGEGALKALEIGLGLRGLAEAEALEELGLIVDGHAGDLGLDGAADGHGRRAGAAPGLAQRRAGRVAPGLLAQVVEGDQRRQREELDARAEGLDLLLGEAQRAQRLALLQVVDALLVHLHLGALLGLLLEALAALLQDAEVEQEQLVVEHLLVALRVGRGGEGRVVEAAHHVDEHVGVAHGLEHLGREGAARAPAGAAHVDEGDLGERGLLGLEEGGEEIDALVRHLDVAVGHLAIGLAAGGQGREHGRLARARVAADSHAHRRTSEEIVRSNTPRSLQWQSRGRRAFRGAARARVALVARRG